MTEHALESAVCSLLEQFEPVRAASPARGSINLSPSILRSLQILIIWLAAVILLQVITSMVHHPSAAATADSYLCKRH
ncbi:MAG: hypothetical protein ACLQO1_19470 [Steroidobacteraceae bacterium]